MRFFNGFLGAPELFYKVPWSATILQNVPWSARNLELVSWSARTLQRGFLEHCYNLKLDIRKSFQVDFESGKNFKNFVFQVYIGPSGV